MKNTFPIILILTALVLTACPSAPSVPNTSVNSGGNSGETTPADTTKPSIGNLEVNSGKLSVTATDPSGIQKVEFYREALNELAAKMTESVAPAPVAPAPVAPAPFFTDTSAPYEYEFDASENGQYNFYVKVFDQKNNVGTSAKTVATIQLTDTKAPAKPVMTLNKTVFSSGETLRATVTTSDNVGVTRVELVLIDGTDNSVLQTATNAPYTFERTMSCLRLKVSAAPIDQPVAPVTNTQSKVFKVVAYDAAENSSASDPQTVTLDCNTETAAVVGEI